MVCTSPYIKTPRGLDFALRGFDAGLRCCRNTCRAFANWFDSYGVNFRVRAACICVAKIVLAFAGVTVANLSF